MVSKLGIYSLLVGFFLGIFAGISNFMDAKNFWVDLTISKIIGEETAESIITFTDIAFIQNTLDVLIYDLTFFLFVIGIGVVFLIISLFVKDH